MTSLQLILILVSIFLSVFAIVEYIASIYNFRKYDYSYLIMSLISISLLITTTI